MTPLRLPGLAFWVHFAVLSAQAASSTAVVGCGHRGRHADTLSLVQLVTGTHLADPEGPSGTHGGAPEEERKELVDLDQPRAEKELDDLDQPRAKEEFEDLDDLDDLDQPRAEKELDDLDQPRAEEEFEDLDDLDDLDQPRAEKELVDLDQRKAERKLVDSDQPRAEKELVDIDQFRAGKELDDLDDLDQPRAEKELVDLDQRRAEKKLVDSDQPRAEKELVDLDQFRAGKELDDLDQLGAEKELVDLNQRRAGKEHVDLDQLRAEKELDDLDDLDQPRAAEELVDLDQRRAGKEPVGPDQPRAGKEHVDLDQPRAGKEPVDLDQLRAGKELDDLDDLDQPRAEEELVDLDQRGAEKELVDLDQLRAGKELDDLDQLRAGRDAIENKSARETGAAVEQIHKLREVEDTLDEGIVGYERQLAATRGESSTTEAVGRLQQGRVLTARSGLDNLEVLDLNRTSPDLVGFTGGFTDHVWGYLVPHSDGEFSGLATRFDLATFSIVEQLDLTAVEGGLIGFMGGFADITGGYGYLVPYIDSVGVYSGKVARFDLATFKVVEWMNLKEIDSDLNGFDGGFSYDGYGYLVPYILSGAGPDSGTYNGKVVRIDLATFNASGVTVLDLTDTDTSLVGFRGGFTDGIFGYCVPNRKNSSTYHGKVARFDLATFNNTGVGVLDLTSADPSLVGFMGGFAHDMYGYVVPYYGGGSAWKGKVARFPLSDFVHTSVQVLDLTAVDVGVTNHNPNLRGFIGGFTDGTYGYLVPHYSGGSPSGHFARFDLATFTLIDFADMTQEDTSLRGFWGGFTDGSHAYVVPHSDGTALSGKVARFSILQPDDDEANLVGDPHCVNLAREKFEIRAAGEHKLIQIPRGPRTREGLKLRVEAVLGHLEPGDCAGTFLESLLIYGAWTSPDGVVEILPGSNAPNTTMLINTITRGRDQPLQDRTVSVKYGGIEFHVAKHYEGRYGKQKAYLNLRVRGLKQYDDVGGILGKDDHRDAEKPPESCVAAEKEAAAAHGAMKPGLVTSLAGWGRSVRDASIGSSLVVLD